MRDTDLRGILLKQFYDHRKKGMLGFHVNDFPSPEIPDGVDEEDVLRVCDQLGNSGLLEWHGIDDPSGNGFMGGCGKITGAGVDVIEGGAKSPIPINIVDYSHHTQNISISGTQGGVQVGGAHSSFEQTITQDIEKLISAINNSSVSEAEKKEAKSKLAAFLGSDVVQTLLGTGVKALIDACTKPM